MEKTKETGTIVLSDNVSQVATKLNNSVMSVIGQEKVMGFEKAYLVSRAISEIKQLLTPEYMKPIMELQGNKLGFKSDKVYGEDVVKNCLIEAVLFGLQPTGNQFNIIAGNMYATKEGCGYLLSKIPGLRYDIIPELPRIKDSSAAIVMNIEWKLGGETQSKKLDIPVKVNNFMGTDAVIGKATRKARKWLYDTITGNELPEGDVTEVVPISIETVDEKKADMKEKKEAKKDATKEPAATSETPDTKEAPKNEKPNTQAELEMLP